jgi:hypothetical protein
MSNVGTNVPAELTVNAAPLLHVREKFPEVPGSKTVFVSLRTEQLLLMIPELGDLTVADGTLWLNRKVIP